MSEHQTKEWKKNKFVLISIGAMLVMILITMCGLIFFKIKIQNSMKEDMHISKESYDKYYVMITPDSDSSFWQSVFEGAKEEAKKNHAYVEILGDNLSVSYSEAEQLRIAIDAKVDGIIVEANESAQMLELINEAVQEGIPVVTALGDNTASVRQSYVGISSYNLGREYGKQVNTLADAYFKGDTADMADKKNEPLQVLVLINANADDSSQNILFSAIQETVESKSDHAGQINLEARAIDTEGAFTAEESIRNIFMTEEDLPDIILCLDELNTTCVYQEIVDYNKVGQITIVGYYDSETILKAIEHNVIYSTISVDTKQMGEYCAEALNEYLQTGYVSEYYAVDTNVITAGNVRNYLGGDADAEK